MDLRVEGSNPSSHPKTDLKGPYIRPDERYPLEVKVLRLSLSSRSVLVVALMLIVVVAVIFGIDLIYGRWDQPIVQPPL